MTALTSTRTSLSFLLLPWLAIQVGARPYHGTSSEGMLLWVDSVEGHGPIAPNTEAFLFSVQGVGKRLLRGLVSLSGTSVDE